MQGYAVRACMQRALRSVQVRSGHQPMAPLDAASLLDHAVLLGLITREQAREARAEAGDRELDSICRVLLRKGMLTSWQLERVKKGDSTGFFFGGCKVLFHLAEGT